MRSETKQKNQHHVMTCGCSTIAVGKEKEGVSPFSYIPNLIKEIFFNKENTDGPLSSCDTASVRRVQYGQSA